MTMPVLIQPVPRLRTRVLGFCLLAGCGVASLQGAEQFWLFTRPLVIPERGAVTSYVLQTSQERYCFLPPADWVVKENAATREVVMMAPTLTTSISFKILPANSDSSVGTDLEEWRKAILKQYPGARMVAESPCHTGTGAGTAFDLERTAANRLKISTRLAVVPMSGGRIEFNLTTPAGKLEEFHLAFGNLLTSFTVEAAATRQTRTNLADAPVNHQTRWKDPDTQSAAGDRDGGGAKGNPPVEGLFPYTIPPFSP